jgi:hypothetical protein
MAITVLNPAGFSELSKHSGNPFLDAMTDLQDVFNTVIVYQQHKPYIDKYSDTSLSDLKDKVKTYLPDAVDEDGSINFAKLEELSNQGNIMAQSILGIKQLRENFANATIGGKLATFMDPNKQSNLDILSGNILTKQAQVLKRKQDFETWVKNSNMPDDKKAMFLANEDTLLNNPNALSIFSQIFGWDQDQQPAQQGQQSSQQQNSDNSNITFQAPQIKSMQDMFGTPQLNINNTKKVDYNNPYEVAQDVLPEVQEFAKTQKQGKKKTQAKIPKLLSNTKTDQNIINALKSAPSYPPVIYSSDQIQGSPQWNNDIINQIVNYRPLFK